jgi:hypothetical protein
MELRAGLPCSEQHRHRLSQEPARYERQRLGGSAVQPLRVVDHTKQRSLLGRHGQQTEQRQRDEESVRARAGPQPECGLERTALRAGKPLEPVK